MSQSFLDGIAIVNIWMQHAHDELLKGVREWTVLTLLPRLIWYLPEIGVTTSIQVVVIVLLVVGIFKSRKACKHVKDCDTNGKHIHWFSFIRSRLLIRLLFEQFGCSVLCCTNLIADELSVIGFFN